MMVVAALWGMGMRTCGRLGGGGWRWRHCWGMGWRCCWEMEADDAVGVVRGGAVACTGRRRGAKAAGAEPRRRGRGRLRGGLAEARSVGMRRCGSVEGSGDENRQALQLLLPMWDPQ